MQIEKLKKIIINQQNEIDQQFQKQEFIERDFDIRKIKKYLSAPNIVVISGVRRSGKSTLALLALQNKKYAHINFDDNQLSQFTVDDFEKLLQAFYELYEEDLEYFIFDEIQNIEGWELFITKLRRTKKIIITGSNANLLSGQLATHLTGRYINITLYPFSFSEFLRYKKFQLKENDIYLTTKIAQINNHLNQYLKTGGFPEVYKISPDIIQNIYENILTKDIFVRHNIRYPDIFKKMSNYLISNFSEIFSYSKLTDIFKIKDEHTTKKYVSYLEESFLIGILEKFSFKLKNQYLSKKKIYPIDTGIVNTIAFQFTENVGRIMENVVFLELQRKKFYQKSGIEIFYWQNYQNQEIDFVIKKGKKIEQLIQVSHSLDNIKTKEREIRSLLKGSEELKCNNLIIITKDDEDELKISKKKIKVIPLWKWLLEK